MSKCAISGKNNLISICIYCFNTSIILTIVFESLNNKIQATRRELLQLFGAYGQLKKVRLPKKFDGGHRGFAFIEFLTFQEAQSAMNALSRTHLYGRHLVLEWATDNEDIETLREKAKRDLVEESGLPNKRVKFN